MTARTYLHGAPYELDEADKGILADRISKLDAVLGLRCGDFVRFADGVERRISHIWRDEDGDPFSVQTSDGGSFYLGAGYVSMSGSLYTGVKPETLTLTDETREGSVWFFHHDRHFAHNGVDAVVTFRLYECALVATR